ncbi:DUF226 domain-containing protein [Borrelia miyamotoi]|uniref:DUF226 domain-containing protein n=1 Tax=Borrelia miyamotoi TaxID=47466 RepID=A0AAQ2WX46_9SPIR|nr:DUF226 domain-containing protein [Borrelia miyamotoi]AOW96088.1 hypothetical protein AXH25_05250 [Borrelia miyamotoi]QTL84203.1 DUF226 domain-containing protein [Borrelia miyamotoi]WAZ85850.1 DUF226 domain-containing protein [Borrelia miyamotoi]WAZ91632.1 DUF226 domain-containing protein [Borrelia miyamotoi]WAZ92924.1 DUF226 domain-containing protein [Borrelia miyamotoi]
MENVLERLKKKSLKIKEKIDKPIFVKVENKNDRMLYHTKIMNDLLIFGVHKKQTNKFFIAFRELFNQEKIKALNLFSVIDNDKFLGIFYGYRKPIQNVVKKYEENGVIKMSTFSKVYYIEFRFKKGSVCCYIKGISRLLKKEKINTKYYNSLVEKLLSLENEVYKFYNKKRPDEGIITKWIKKNQK